ncbi:mechanosensitive ion channel family protein [Aestuariirhabdus sp. Z084]|uniref:mechanosensitive ion channel family protein n=1 Tax=Aestuariirhabdus haliotis TaxID=2918751 RepID=UPI00201B373E|nr:mechanosensitive ion channel family protein [Aestuariirhabdus haliotis]MCL6415040.1 mechanosensitive ion channel family protein [Aestuariirhabdus haliotis]MCL6418972.1 mechanosensitive ion channel family protein [Aestuariirhabdus haliotis]
MDEEVLQQELAQLQGVYNMVAEFLVEYSFQILGALIIFLLGLWLAGKAHRVVAAQLARHNVDVTLAGFISNLVRILVILMMAIIALGKLGISVAPFIAALGAMALGAGLALQGMLSNYAAGVTIILTRPFVVGNTVKVQGVCGVIKEINLSMTILTNEEGEEISIPNKHIVGEILHNSFQYMLVETSIGISYGDDPEQAVQCLRAVLSAIPEVANEPAPQIGIDNFADSAIEIGVRYWVPTPNYYEVKFSTNLALFNALKDQGINIPFPQREVRMLAQ